MTGQTDQAALLRAQMTAIARDLNNGRLPVIDATGLTPENTATLVQLEQAADHIIRKNISLLAGLETMRDGFAIFGPDLRLMYCNGSFRGFFGSSIRVDRGTHFNMLADAVERSHTIIHDEVTRSWRQVVLTDHPPPLLMRFTSGRAYRWAVRRDELGNRVCLATDVTAECERQKQIELARRNAEDAAAAKARFLTHMSHELRTPMNGVIGMTELLQDCGLVGEQQRYVDTIRNSAEALLGLINSVLDFAGGQHAAGALRRELFDLEKMASEVVTLLMPNAADKGLTLALRYHPLTPAEYWGDPGRMRQVLVNLVGNAVKYTHHGSVRLIIVGNEKGVNIVVHDTGPGIDDDQLDRIFEEFAQISAPGTTAQGSSGLGLTITDTLVREMGGKLWVTSETGAGSTFGASLALTGQPRPPLVGFGVADALTILLVHPIPADAHRARRHLLATGVRMCLAHDLAAAQAILAGGVTPNLVVVHSEIEGAQPLLVRDTLAPLVPHCQFWLLAAGRIPACGNHFDRIISTVIARGQVVSMLRQGTTRLADMARDRGDREQMIVLIADDNATNRLVIEKMLRQCDIRIISASDGQQAVELWHLHKPQLIFMDIQMPVLDGSAATKAIRDAEITQGLPRTGIVAVTADVSEPNRSSLLHGGIDEVVAKPVRRAALTDLLLRFAPAYVRPPVPDRAA